MATIYLSSWCDHIYNQVRNLLAFLSFASYSLMIIFHDWYLSYLHLCWKFNIAWIDYTVSPNLRSSSSAPYRNGCCWNRLRSESSSGLNLFTDWTLNTSCDFSTSVRVIYNTIGLTSVWHELDLFRAKLDYDHSKIKLAWRFTLSYFFESQHKKIARFGNCCVCNSCLFIHR